MNYDFSVEFSALAGTKSDVFKEYISRQSATSTGFLMFFFISDHLNWLSWTFWHCLEIMKFCLLCYQEYKANNIISQQPHYENFHSVNKNNYFYYNLFEKDRNDFIPNKCVRYDYFLLNCSDNFNFFQHYQQGGNLQFESRPINIKRYDRLVYYSFPDDDHHEFHSFFDSEKTVRNFINLFELKFVPVKKKSKLNVCFWLLVFNLPLLVVLLSW